jgi:DNA-binding NtrC family response regulator
MPLAAQVRLLRVLETGEFSRVGSSTTLNSDARVIAATNKDLAREVQTGRFREDLYYRLSTVIIKIPPLRDRTDDILPILDSFVHHFAQKYNTPAKQLTDEARRMLVHYRWPGNVRELRNLAEQMIVLVPKREVDVEDIRPFMRGVSASGVSNELVLASGGRANWQDGDDDEPGANDVKLIFRALLEESMEIRERKEQFRSAFGGAHRNESHDPVHRENYERSEPPIFFDRYESDNPLLPAVEDISYEIEAEINQDLLNGVNREKDDSGTDKPVFPTLEAAEQQLIADALKHFQGNRRQTARALGISERTLYRKLKDLDEEL